MPPSDPACVALGIPAYLHQNGRAPDPQFSNSEKLFVRFALGTPSIQTAVTFRRQSCNREKYCGNGATDVLFDTGLGRLHQDCGVMSITVAEVRVMREQIGEREFTLRPEHRPEQCNYAHAKIVAHENGSPVDDIGPRSVKKQLRDTFTTCFRIELPIAQTGEQLRRG